MLNKYKNDLMQMILDYNLDPASFQLIERTKSLFVKTPSVVIKCQSMHAVFIIYEHRGDEHVFNWKSLSKVYGSWYGVYDNYFFFLLSINGWIYFKSLREGFDMWLRDNIKPFIEAENMPDLWQNTNAYHSFTGFSYSSKDNDTKPFTDKEKAEIRRAMLVFHKSVVENFKPTPQQDREIKVRLDYLVAAIDRMNRFDWKGVALSTIISIGINLTVDTAKGQLLFSLFQQAFNEVIKLLPSHL